ncbi:MAG: DMT family transporter [Lentisphaeria bacterium]|nr:DMT family transporter [Lentisphaeria bacterium]
MRQNTAILMVIGATAMWGMGGLFAQKMDVMTTTIAWLRCFFPFAILLLTIVPRAKLHEREGKGIAFAGSTVNMVRMFFFFWGFTNTSISNAVLMLYTWPVWATVLAHFVLGERITKRHILLLMGSFVGIAVIQLDNLNLQAKAEDYLGMASMVVSSILYSISMILFKKVSPMYKPMELLFWQNLVCVFVFFPIFWQDPNWLEPIAWGWGALLGVLVGFVGFGLFFAALKQMEASKISVFCFTEVLFAMLYSCLFFNEQLSVTKILGALILIGSSIALSVQPKVKKDESKD